MSRSGYYDDIDNWELIKWRGAVTSAIRGRRGQAFLREMLAELDALPKKRLIPNDLVRDGEVCAIGAVAVARGLDVSDIDPEDRDQVAAAFGIATALAAEIEDMNDERFYGSPEERFAKMRRWVETHIKKDTQ